MTPDQKKALARWITAETGLAGDLQADPITGGQSNPTYFVTMDGRQMVLRKQPPGPLLKGAHAIDREYRVQSALAGTGVPVPEMIAWCEDPGILGTPFYLMERVEGRIFHQASMPGATPEDRHAMYLAAARVMAAMHSVDPDTVGLGDFGRPGDYFARQLSRWGRQWAEAQTRDIPGLDHVQNWLETHLPEDDGAVSIAHGDFRIGNILFAPERPNVAAVLDWELSTLGHPLADLGFFCMCWRSRQNEYGGFADMDRETLGIPSKDEFLSEYRSKSRHMVEMTSFHEVFAFYRFAVIFVGIADRGRQGNATGDAAADATRLARAFASHGEAVIAETS